MPQAALNPILHFYPPSSEWESCTDFQKGSAPTEAPNLAIISESCWELSPFKNLVLVVGAKNFNTQPNGPYSSVPAEPPFKQTRQVVGVIWWLLLCQINTKKSFHFFVYFINCKCQVSNSTRGREIKIIEAAYVSLTGLDQSFVKRKEQKVAMYIKLIFL